VAIWVLVGVLVLKTGCGRSSPESQPRRPDNASRHAEKRSDTTVTDALGRTVEFRHPATRVVSLAPNLTEIVFAAGAGDRLVAVTTSDDHPPAVDTLARIGALPIDFEAVTAQQPDLVLATNQINAPRDVETFDALDIPIAFLSFERVEDVFSAIRRTGQYLGTDAIAADSADALAASISRLQNRTRTVEERPRVLVLIGDDTLYSFGGSSYVHTLVQAAGGRSVTASLGASAPTLSEEYVLEQQPDVIIGAWGTDYNPSRLLTLHPTWDVVPAVENGRVYSLDADLLLRPGPRLVHGAWQMARHLHPSLIEGQTPTPPPTSSSRSPSRP